MTAQCGRHPPRFSLDIAWKRSPHHHFPAPALSTWRSTETGVMAEQAHRLGPDVLVVFKMQSFCRNL
ncbi:MAG: hypothetical protein MZV70_16670 [Desulfobacterales bacterium]|nr:hypothetical protein [Desulfobacterales bacterium]